MRKIALTDPSCWCGTLAEYDGSERHYREDKSGGVRWVDCADVIRAYIEQAKDDPLEWVPHEPPGAITDLGEYLKEMVRLAERMLERLEAR